MQSSFTHLLLELFLTVVILACVALGVYFGLHSAVKGTESTSPNDSPTTTTTASNNNNNNGSGGGDNNPVSTTTAAPSDQPQLWIAEISLICLAVLITIVSFGFYLRNLSWFELGAINFLATLTGSTRGAGAGGKAMGAAHGSNFLWKYYAPMSVVTVLLFTISGLEFAMKQTDNGLAVLSIAIALGMGLFFVYMMRDNKWVRRGFVAAAAAAAAYFGSGFLKGKAVVEEMKEAAQEGEGDAKGDTTTAENEAETAEKEVQNAIGNGTNEANKETGEVAGAIENGAKTTTQAIEGAEQRIEDDLYRNVLGGETMHIPGLGNIGAASWEVNGGHELPSTPEQLAIGRGGAHGELDVAQLLFGGLAFLQILFLVFKRAKSTATSVAETTLTSTENQSEVD